jgi:hypothetical protein
VEVLLKNGADPNQRVEKLSLEAGENIEPYEGKTPLEITLGYLDKGHNSYKNRPIVFLLLKAGARITPAQLSHYLSNQSGLLRGELLKDSNLQQMLFESVATYAEDDSSAAGNAETASQFLEQAARQNLNIVPLIKAGAVPSNTWKEEFFSGATGEGLELLNQKFLYPELGSPESIVLFQPAIFSNARAILTTLAEKEVREDLPDFARALLDSDISLATKNNQLCPIRLELWRKNKAGQVVSQELDLTSEDSLPELQWGDLVTITVKDSTSTKSLSSPQDTLTQSPGNGQTADYDWKPLNQVPTIYWHLRKRIAFPVKVTQGDSTREILLRGDRLIYDPHKPEVPLLAAGQLGSFFGGDIAGVTIRREGWEDVVLRKGLQTWPQFPLQKNDELILGELEVPEEDRWGTRANQISLRVAEAKRPTFIDTSSTELPPTLSEFLVKAYASWGSVLTASFSNGEPEGLGEIASSATHPSLIPTLMAHPDFSRIRIHRLNADNEETTLEVNLAKVIAACDEDTTPGEAREGDLALKTGDIVELSLQEKQEQWTGFSKEQLRYFSKVLTASIQVTDQNEEVSMRSIDWTPVEWTETAAGLLPLAPESGAVSSWSWDVISQSGYQLIRDDNYYRWRSSFYLRNGDRIDLSTPELKPRERKLSSPSSKN